MTTSCALISYGHGNATNRETPMYAHDLLARERQASLERDAGRRWTQHRLTMEATQARRADAQTRGADAQARGDGASALSPLRRARVRLGGALVSTGRAIAGSTENGSSANRVRRPA